VSLILVSQFEGSVHPAERPDPGSSPRRVLVAG
jgi:hypothetical protein